MSDSVDLTKDVFHLNEVIIPNLIKKTLFIHSLTFPQIKEHFKKEELDKLNKNLKTFLDQSQCYLDTF